MRYLRLALLPLLIVACTERAPVAPIEDGAAFNWMNNPDLASPVVFRDAMGHGFVWAAWDAKEVANGVIPWTAALITNGTYCDGDYGEVTDGAYQVVDHSMLDPDATWQWIRQGEMFVSVYKLEMSVDDFLAVILEDCDFTINGAAASGVVHYMNHDNSLPGYNPLWHRTNAWGYHLQGELTRADGGRAHFSYVFELPVGANGIHTYQEHLNYTPIGQP